ncbi:MAG TPA: hypothetical protein VF950_23590 [Planctomycetota bacterium]
MILASLGLLAGVTLLSLGFAWAHESRKPGAARELGAAALIFLGAMLALPTAWEWLTAFLLVHL